MTTSRILVSILIVSVVTIGALQLDRMALAGVSRDLITMIRSPAIMQEEGDRSQVLADDLQRMQEMIAGKRRLADELLAGRLTLRQAAAEFEALSKNAPHDWDYYAPAHPEWSLEIRCAQYVIEEVEWNLRDAKRDPQPIVKHLQAEKASW
jgi:hypothetical protein